MSKADATPPDAKLSMRDRLRVVATDAAADAKAEASAPIETGSQLEAEIVADLTAADRQQQRRASRIAPHAARHANRARRTWFAYAFFPIFAVYVVVDALRDLHARIARARGIQIEARPPFQRPAGMPTGAARSVADIVESIERFPYRPANLSTSAAFFRDNGADALGALLSPNPQITTIPHMYPMPFEQRLFTGDQGIQMAGMQAMHAHRGPAIIISHGLLMTKNFDMIIQLAKRAYEQWGFHVVTLDLRSWGQSAWTTDAPASAGYHEGRDIVEVARELHRDPRVTSVAGVGFSLGGASMLNAAHVSSLSEDRPLDGGIVAISPPTKIAEALEHISTKPHWRDPYFGLWHVFQAAIKSIVRRGKLSPDVKTWLGLVEHLSAPWYGIPLDEFAERASAANFAGEIDQPVFVLHAADDFLVPVHHAYALQDAVVDNPNVHVRIHDKGAHVSFAAIDSSWYHSTLRRWFEYWSTAPGDEPEDAPID